jgi:membrane protease YdiL (CAAX protease family)
MNPKYNFFPNAETGRLNEEDTRKYFSRFCISVFVMELVSFVLTYAFVFAAEEVLNYAYPAFLDDANFTTVLENLIHILSLYCIAMPIFWSIASPLPTVRPQKVKLGLGKWLGGLCICLLLMTAGGYIASVLITLIEMIPGGSSLTNPVDTMLADTSLWVDVLFVVILAPIFEELLFRKFLCNKLLALGEGYAVLLSGVIFGLSHGNFFQMPYALLVGFMLGFIYVKTGKLIYTIGYHMVLNLIGGVIAPWVIDNVDLEKLDSLLYEIEPAMEEMTAMLIDMIPLLIYEMVVMGLSVIGLVFLIFAITKKQITFQSGILSPAKEHKFANIVCTVGAAALVTVYVIYFVISILPSS